jgi:hypothetical protein
MRMRKAALELGEQSVSFNAAVQDAAGRVDGGDEDVRFALHDTGDNDASTAANVLMETRATDARRHPGEIDCLVQGGNGDRRAAAARRCTDSVVTQHGRIIGAGAVATCRPHFLQKLEGLFVITARNIAVCSEAHGGEDGRRAAHQQPLRNRQRFAEVATSAQNVPVGRVMSRAKGALVAQ